MPAFMGTLSTPPQPAAHSLLAKVAQSADPHGPAQDAVPITPEVLEQVAAATNSSGKEGKTWTPSGGHKIASEVLIVLENVAHGFTQPNVIDLKLGARLWDDAAPMEKRKKLDDVSKSSTSSSLGFRVAGMKVWTGIGHENDNSLVKSDNVKTENGYRSYNKFYGRDFKGKDVTGAFDEFLYSAEHCKGLLARRILAEMEEIEDVLKKQESRMYSASILIVYEGDVRTLEQKLKEEEQWLAKYGGKEDAPTEEEEEEEEEDDEERPKTCEVKLIDFAHASWTPGMGPDENVLQGVRSIVEIMREIASKKETDD